VAVINCLVLEKTAFVWALLATDEQTDGNCHRLKFRQYRVGQKNKSQTFVSISSPNIDGFSKFFHRHGNFVITWLLNIHQYLPGEDINRSLELNFSGCVC